MQTNSTQTNNLQLFSFLQIRVRRAGRPVFRRRLRNRPVRLDPGLDQAEEGVRGRRGGGRPEAVDRRRSRRLFPHQDRVLESKDVRGDGLGEDGGGRGPEGCRGGPEGGRRGEEGGQRGEEGSRRGEEGGGGGTELPGVRTFRIGLVDRQCHVRAKVQRVLLL